MANWPKSAVATSTRICLGGEAYLEYCEVSRLRQLILVSPKKNFGGGGGGEQKVGNLGKTVQNQQGPRNLLHQRLIPIPHAK